jgi:oligopeptide/dipeptide ABC transporter ATP-binding protein
VAGFGQTIPLGNRLARAREAELLEREVRLRGLESVHRQLRKRVHGSFATALYQESAFEAQGRITAGLASMVAVTKARLDAGDVIPQDLARSEMVLARAEVELRSSESLRKQGLIALAAAVGDPDLEVRSVEGSLEVAFEVPTLDSLAANLSTQPELQAAEAGVRASGARIALAKAERIPDVKVEALYHRLEVSGQNTFDLGISIPMPLFNRNQGRLREARSETLAAEARVRNTLGQLSPAVYLGHVVELGTTDQVFSPPYHPYTEALLSAVPIADTRVTKKRIVLEGDIPSAMNPPPGCPFQTRCRWKSQVPGNLCETVMPPIRVLAGDHQIKCHLSDDVLAGMEPVIRIAAQ